jgi:hypothetical protein
MLLVTLGFVFVVFAVLALALVLMIGLCFLAAAGLITGLALRTSRFAWLSPFLMWIPSLAAAFAVTFFSYTAISFKCGFPLPDSFTGYPIAFLLGELTSIAVGTALALRTHHTKSDQPRKLTTKPPLNVES